MSEHWIEAAGGRDWSYLEKDRSGGSVVFCDAEFKADGDDSGLVEGLASTFEKDLDGDVIHRGAFTKTVKERVPAGRVPLLDSHIWTAGHTIGRVVEASEVDKGLRFRAEVASTPDAQAIRQKMVEGMLNFVSIGFMPVKQDFTEEKPDDGGRSVVVRHIREVKLFEVSVVPIPANEGAKITRVKSLARAPSVDLLLYDLSVGAIDEDLFLKTVAGQFDWLSSLFSEDLKSGLVKLLDSLSGALVVEGPKSAEPGSGKDVGPPLTGEDRARVARRLDQLGARLSARFG